jgi:type III pantothenate kinase
MFGQAEAIDGIVRRIKKSWPRKQEPIVIATGGLAEVFRTLCSEFDRVEPHLTLAGLQMAFAHLTAAPVRSVSKRPAKLAKRRL